MKINDVSNVEAYQKQVNITKEKKEISSDVKVTEETIKTPEDKIDISILKEEADKAYAHLRTIVEDLLRRQGIEIETLKDLKPEDIKVDQQARDEAKQMIEDGGPLSPEAVSDRIVDFAKSISNGDKSKLKLLRESIEEGFEQAKEMMGGELPEISSQTYDMIQEKLDAWENEQ
jgi:hypothetical protein